MMPAVRLAAAALLVIGGTCAVQAQSPPAATPRPPFPADARIAFVNLPYVFASSRDGKAATTELQALETKKNADIAAKTTEVQALEQKLSQGTTLLNDSAREQLERAVVRAKVDFDRLVQDSQAEVQERQQQFQRAFSRKLFPAIGEIAKAKNLWAVFTIGEQTLLWHNAALDISDELVVKIDSAR